MYIYKKATTFQDYDRLHSEWSVKHTQWMEAFPDDPDADPNFNLRQWLARGKRLEKAEPMIEYWNDVPAGPFWVDILRGYCPVKLLFHQPFGRKGFPYEPIRQLLASQKAHHKHWGPYDHKLRINLYAADQIGGMITLEVDLWEKLIDVDALVDPALAEVRTGVQRVKIFHS